MDRVLRRWSTRGGINFQTLPRTPTTEYAARAWFAKGAILGPFLDEIGCSWTRLKPQTPPRTPTTEYAAGFGILKGPRFQTFAQRWALAPSMAREGKFWEGLGTDGGTRRRGPGCTGQCSTPARCPGNLQPDRHAYSHLFGWLSWTGMPVGLPGRGPKGAPLRVIGN